MRANHLEQLCAEWYEYRGYVVRRNVREGQKEVDLFAFKPGESNVIQIEAGVDFDGWPEREIRYAKKFAFGADYVMRHYPGVTISERLAVQVEVRNGKKVLGGGRIMLVEDLLREIAKEVGGRSLDDQAIPESFPFIRTIQMMVHFGVPTNAS